MSQEPAEEPPVGRTGPVGRLVRAALGVGLLFALLWPISRAPTFAEATTVQDPMFWVLTAIALLSIPYILDVGLSLGTGRRVQFLLVALAGPLAGIGLFFTEQVWAWPLAGLVLLLQVWVLGTLALGYLLAAVLGTPGCELRAFAHLVARYQGREPGPAMFCPAGLDSLDAWEARRKGS
ncbi:MAG: hypothetical protein R3185_02950 [Candidatus Thermoplasmatota archaeon]|nr:hypothetical protein [Candidatus Thermoplasmatota archaeon]